MINDSALTGLLYCCTKMILKELKWLDCSAGQVRLGTLAYGAMQSWGRMPRAAAEVPEKPEG